MSESEMKPVKVACVQAAPVFLDVNGGLDKADALCREAVKNGAKFIAFPEVWIPGYPWWLWTHPSLAAMEFLPRYDANAIAMGSPQMHRLQKIAHDNGIAMVMGYCERDHGSRYISQVFIDENGTILFNRRKLKPTHVERTMYGEGDGSHLKAVNMSFGRVGGLNCAEHAQPLMRMAMYEQREFIHVASWPSFSMGRDVAYGLGPEVAQAATQLYAMEGACYSLLANAVVSQEILDIVAQGDPDKLKVLSPLTGKPGGAYSMIYEPGGKPLCEALPEDADGILYADADPVAVTLAKGTLDLMGHYSRGDAVRLLVNRAPRTVVQEVGGASEFTPLPFEDFQASNLAAE